jgi:Immunity protein Imm1
VATLNAHYAVEHADNPVVVASADDVAALFTAVRDRYPEGAATLITVVVADDPWGQQLSAGVDGDKGVLFYSGQRNPQGAFSKSPEPSNPEPVIYYFETADTEFPPNSEVPVSVVEAAVAEYLTTGGHQPACVEWQTAD